MRTPGSDCSIKIGAIHHLASLGTDNVNSRKKLFENFQCSLVSVEYGLIKMAHPY